VLQSHCAFLEQAPSVLAEYYQICCLAWKLNHITEQSDKLIEVWQPQSLGPPKENDFPNLLCSLKASAVEIHPIFLRIFDNGFFYCILFLPNLVIASMYSWYHDTFFALFTRAPWYPTPAHEWLYTVLLCECIYCFVLNQPVLIQVETMQVFHLSVQFNNNNVLFICLWFAICHIEHVAVHVSRWTNWFRPILQTRIVPETWFCLGQSSGHHSNWPRLVHANPQCICKVCEIITPTGTWNLP
jgi:hypothetical protein